MLTREYLLDTRSINYSVSTAFSLLIHRHSFTKAFTFSNSYSLFERVLFLYYKREKDLEFSRVRVGFSLVSLFSGLFVSSSLSLSSFVVFIISFLKRN